MQTYKITLGYLGTRYSGWQSQTRGDSVQEMIEKELKRLFKTKTDLIGSSRTDAGVHAKALCAHFRADTHIATQKIKDALNFYLPADIVIYDLKKVRADFHARYHAKSKTYHYRIWNDQTRPLWEKDTVLWVPWAIDLSKMNAACKSLKGTHDFRAFADRIEKDEKTIRCIYQIRVFKKSKMVTLEVTGDGFLRHMIRVIAGTLLEVGRGKMTLEQFKQALKSCDRRLAGPTAKPCGLMLMKVFY